MNTQVLSLPNGLRIVHTEIPHSRVVHCGFVINAGSRDERPNEGGIAHFIEHMVFKGTTRRKTFHILNYLESVGGDVNAYTTKEKTCFYATVTPEYVDRATELLSDITFNSTFPEKEMDKERQVIAEEIDMYNDSPEDAILEDFELMICPDHPLGRPIAGTKESVNLFTRDQLLDFIQRNHTAGRVVFSVVGKVSFEKVKKIAQKYLAGITLPALHARTQPQPGYVVKKSTKKVSGQQAHRVIGGEACDFLHEKYIPVSVLNNFLGGPANNNLLNLNIREKYGLTYNIYSFFSPFVDSGIWGIYYSCEPGNQKRIARMVDRELAKLRTQKIGTIRLNQIKKQMVGQLTIGSESLLSRMLAQAKNTLDYDRDYTLEELAAQVESVSASDLMDAANYLFDPEKTSELTYLPAE